MGSKFIVFHILMGLSILGVRLEAGRNRKVPIVHFIDGMSYAAPIGLHIKAGNASRSAEVQAGQDYGMRVESVEEVYYVVGVCGSRFASFHAYEPARDKGRAAVFWKANYKGFAMSHDKVHWKMAAPWESE